MNHRHQLIKLSCILVFSCASARVDGGPGTDREAVRENASLWWESLSTLEFRCDEAAPGAGGTIDSTKPFTRHEYRSAPGGCRAITSSARFPDGKIVVTKKFREDGKIRCDILPFSADSNSISSITVRNQRNTGEEYHDVMFSTMWLIMPGGRPVHSLIDAGATVSPRGSEDELLVDVVAKHPKTGRPLLCTLDPGHDWLPKEVTSGTGRSQHRWSVETFRRDNGRWFPATGRFTATTPKGIQDYRFEVSEVRINRPLDRASFAMPVLPDGVLILDQRTGTNSVKGGPEAERRLRSRFVAATTRSADPRAPGGTHAASDPTHADVFSATASRERFPWSRLLFYGSTTAIVAGVLLAALRGRRGGDL